MKRNTMETYHNIPEWDKPRAKSLIFKWKSVAYARDAIIAESAFNVAEDCINVIADMMHTKKGA